MVWPLRSSFSHKPSSVGCNGWPSLSSARTMRLIAFQRRKSLSERRSVMMPSASARLGRVAPSSDCAQAVVSAKPNNISNAITLANCFTQTGKPYTPNRGVQIGFLIYFVIRDWPNGEQVLCPSNEHRDFSINIEKQSLILLYLPRVSIHCGQQFKRVPCVELTAKIIKSQGDKIKRC